MNFQTAKRVPCLKALPSAEELCRYGVDLKGILFDMDGTLLNTEPIHTLALWKLLELANRNHPYSCMSELNDRLCGLCDEDVFNVLSPYLNCDAFEFIFQKNQILSLMSVEESFRSCLSSEMQILLKDLKKRGLFIGLVSASQSEVVDAFLRSLDLHDFFDVVIGRSEVNRTKPDPAPYQMACERLGIGPHEALALEDSSTGMESARGAGVHLVQVDWF